MAALTPHRVSVHGGVSPLHVLALPDHSVPNHPTSSRGRFLTLPLSAAGVLADQTSPSPSGLVTTPDRNGFALLRTGRSPPVALHPALRRRSYSRLQAGERMPEVDSHHSVRVPSRAHWEANTVRQPGPELGGTPRPPFNSVRRTAAGPEGHPFVKETVGLGLRPDRAPLVIGQLLAS
jgi:hypothetical protein